MKRILIVFLVSIASCTTVAKQQRKAETFVNANPQVLAKWCADKFPVDTVFKQGQTIIKSDTTIIKGDSIPCPPAVDQNGDTFYVKVKCPDSKIIHDTIKKVDTITKIDNARVYYLSYKSDSLTQKLIQVTAEKKNALKSAGNRLWWIIGLVVILGISIFINIKNFNNGRTSKYDTAERL